MALPTADSSAPRAFTTAARPAAYPGPICGRAAKSAISPTTSLSWMVVSAAAPPLPPPPVSAPAVATLTSRTRTGCALDGTDHVSWNCTRPSLL